MDDEKSKSQKKRDADALQKLGVSLVEWRIENLDKLPLPDPLRQAILLAKSLKSHGARRRQAQLIGKLMRLSDLEAFTTAYNAIQADESAQTAGFHDVEVWRDRLVMEGPQALTDFVNAHHPDDLQQCKQLIKKAIDDHKNEKNTGASRALFRYIRACLA